MSMILVTGGSGFIAAHCIVRLLAAGYDVRTTVRSHPRFDAVRGMVAQSGGEPDGRLTCAVADLKRDDGWRQAVQGCEYVLHVASPFPAAIPKHDDELIVPAREGTLRLLRAARDARVKRVVMTSSFAAIGYGHAAQDAPFDEGNWTNLAAPGLSAYVKSKTLAERAAWAFLVEEGGALELSVVNPVAVFGPVLGSDLSASTLIVERMLSGAIPGCADIYFGVVDVRDVADLHLMAMTDPAAKGERFLAVAGACVSMLQVAQILKNRMGASARRVRTRRLPNWLLRTAALGSPLVRAIVPELGRIKSGTHAKAQRLLGWSPRSNEESIVATAESLLRLGVSPE